MPKEILHISSFLAGTKTTPSETDITLDTAAYSLNVDPVAEDGKLTPIPEDNKETAPAVGLTDVDHALPFVTDDVYGVAGYDKEQGRWKITTDIYQESSDREYLEFAAPINKEVATVRNNKEIHIGFGANEKAKWLGKVTGKQYNEAIPDIQYLDAELVVPGDFGTMKDSFTLVDDTYSISHGGKRLYKFDFSAGTFIHSNIEFSHAVAICPNKAGDGIWVYDRDDTTNGALLLYNLSLVQQIRCPIFDDVMNASEAFVETTTIVESNAYVWFQASVDTSGVPVYPSDDDFPPWLFNVATPTTSGNISPARRDFRLETYDVITERTIFNNMNFGGSYLPAITGDDQIGNNKDWHSPFMFKDTTNSIIISILMDHSASQLQFSANKCPLGELTGVASETIQTFTVPSKDHTVFAVDYTNSLIWVFSTDNNEEGNGPVVLKWTYGTVPGLVISEVNIHCSKASDTSGSDTTGGTAGLAVSDWATFITGPWNVQHGPGVNGAVVDGTNSIVFYTVNNNFDHPDLASEFSYHPANELDNADPGDALYTSGHAQNFIYSTKYVYSSGSNRVTPTDLQIDNANNDGYANTVANGFHHTDSDYYWFNSSSLPPDMQKNELDSGTSNYGLGAFSNSDNGYWTIPMFKHSVDEQNRLLTFRSTLAEDQWYVVKYQAAGSFNRPFESEEDTYDGYIKYLGHWDVADSVWGDGSNSQSYFKDVKLDGTNDFVHLLTSSQGYDEADGIHNLYTLATEDFNSVNGTSHGLSSRNGFYGNRNWDDDATIAIEKFRETNTLPQGYIKRSVRFDPEGYPIRANALHIDEVNKRMLVELDYDNDAGWDSIQDEDQKNLTGYRILSYDVGNLHDDDVYLWLDSDIPLTDNVPAGFTAHDNMMNGGTRRETIGFLDGTIIYFGREDDAIGDWIQRLNETPEMAAPTGTHDVVIRSLQCVWHEGYQVSDSGIFRATSGSADRPYIGVLIRIKPGKIGQTYYGEENALLGTDEILFLVVIISETHTQSAISQGRYFRVNGANDYGFISDIKTMSTNSANSLTMFQYAANIHDRTSLALITGVIYNGLAHNSNLAITTTVDHSLFEDPTISLTYDTGVYKFYYLGGRVTGYYYRTFTVSGSVWDPLSGVDETKKIDSFLSLGFASSGSGGFIDTGKDYFYKLSLVYDGYQESPLSSVFVADSGSVSGWGAGENITITITITMPELISKRVTAIKLYRAENTDTAADKPLGFYRLVETLPLDAIWTLSGETRVQAFMDLGDQFSSYEANTGISEGIPTTTLEYQMSTVLNNHHFVAKASNRYLPDAQNYIFKSRPYNFDQFDWTTDFLILSEFPSVLVPFNGRLLVFTSNRTYRVEPNDFYIEDTFDGVGCYGPQSFIVTEYGLFFADNNNIYMHNGKTPIAIGDAILRNDDYAYQNRDKTVIPRVMFDSERNSVLVFFKTNKGGGQYNYHYAWAFNIARRRWDLWRFDDDPDVAPKGFTYGKYGEMLISDGSLMRHYLGHATDKRKYSWTSKKITCNSPTMDKVFSKMTIIGNNNQLFAGVHDGTSFLKVNETDVTYEFEADGLDGDYKLIADKKGKFLQFALSEQSEEIDAIGIEYRRRRKLDFGDTSGSGSET